MQVDIFSMGVIELVNRAGAPLFHIEHYIDGEYIKYNSNLSFKSKFIIAPLFHIEHYIDGEYIKYNSNSSKQIYVVESTGITQTLDLWTTATGRRG